MQIFSLFNISAILHVFNCLRKTINFARFLNTANFCGVIFFFFHFPRKPAINPTSHPERFFVTFPKWIDQLMNMLARVLNFWRWNATKRLCWVFCFMMTAHKVFAGWTTPKWQVPDFFLHFLAYFWINALPAGQFRVHVFQAAAAINFFCNHKAPAK